MKCHLSGLSTPIERIQYSIASVGIEFHQSIWDFFWKRTWMFNKSRGHWGDVPDGVCNLFCPLFMSCRKSFSSSASATVHVSFSQHKDEFMHYIRSIVFWIRIDYERPISVCSTSHFVPNNFFMQIPVTEWFDKL